MFTERLMVINNYRQILRSIDKIYQRALYQRIYGHR